MRIFHWLTNSIKELMEYYEEDIYKPLEDFFKKHEVINTLVIFCIFLGIYLPFLWRTDSSTWHTSESNTTKRHLTSRDLLEYFPNNYKLRSIFQLLDNRIESTTSSKTPLAIILAGKNLTEEELKFKVISNKHFWMDNITVHVNGSLSESSLFHEVSDKLEKLDGKAFVFIEEIEKLPGKTPLVLQTLSDVDAAKYKEPVFILTVVDERFDENMGEKECTEMITRKLEKAWSQSLHSDQLQPILSRITGITVCLP